MNPKFLMQGIFLHYFVNLTIVYGYSVVIDIPYKILPCQIARVPAIGETKAIDATGAGDLFASGFLCGLVKGLSLEECCRVGACSGGSIIRSLGGEMATENWQWMYKQMQINGLPVLDSHK